jgi:hypothetical protein
MMGREMFDMQFTERIRIAGFRKGHFTFPELIGFIERIKEMKGYDWLDYEGFILNTNTDNAILIATGGRY